MIQGTHYAPDQDLAQMIAMSKFERQQLELLRREFGTPRSDT